MVPASPAERSGLLAAPRCPWSRVSADRPPENTPSVSVSHVSLFATGKVFVTYEADSDKHVNEIIKFVALLRHNGFDTHVRTAAPGFATLAANATFSQFNPPVCFQIDIFEQQFRSISKIDFMERYLSEVRTRGSNRFGSDEQEETRFLIAPQERD